MKTPGLYTYEDTRRGKKSHNKSDNNIYSTTERRFDNQVYYQQNNNDSPGPGHYFGQDLRSGSTFSVENIKLMDYKINRLQKSSQNLNNYQE